MSLLPGTRLGSYTISGQIGAGGMGEVYRARDSRLDRDVAIKVLPPIFAADTERLTRFEREAKTLAALNHPNIAHIHGLEVHEPAGSGSSATRALVMELVEGEDLAARLARGAVPLAEALPIAKQIAEALEAAHEQGIIHRDLKPANVKVRSDGTVKVLDFGLAKALTPDGSGATGDVINSPTLTVGATQMGMILGTAAYMAPEQARGKTVDRRADIWSFGVVLAELLTGERAFKGEGVSEVLAKVIEREPDLSGLPANTPSSVRRLLTRCLAKDPKQRLRDIGEARIAIAEGERELMQGHSSPTGMMAPATAVRAWRRALPWVLVTGLAGTLALVLMPSAGDPINRSPIARTQIGLPPGVELYSAVGASLSLSPDGTTLAFVGVGNGVRRVYLRRLDQFEVTSLAGTETAVACVFSPDGRYLLVGLADSSLRRLRLSDNLVDPVAPNSSEYLGGWTSDGRIVLTKEGRLWLLSNTPGAAPTQLTTAEPGSTVIDFKPVPVPGTDALLFASGRPEAQDTSRIDALRIDTMTRSTVVERAGSPTLTSTGHLLFLRDGVVMAARFDARTLTLTGEPSPVLRDVNVVRNRGVSAIMTVSDTGTLVYAHTLGTPSEIVSVSRAGADRTLVTAPRPVANPRLTTDGRWLLFEEIGGALWVQDLERQSLARLTDGTTLAAFPILTRDGREAIYRSPGAMFRVPLDGSRKPTKIAGTQANEYPTGLTPDGTTLIYTRIAPNTAGDIYELPLAGGEPKLLVSTAAYEGGAQLSPDGKWLVYASNEGGSSEIFVQPYPALDRRIQVSSGGGVQPAWNPKGGEMVYRSGDKMMSVRLTATPAGPVLTPPVALFAGRAAYGGGLTIANFSVASDGDHFIVVRDQSGASVNVVFNWFDELARVQ